MQVLLIALLAFAMPQSVVLYDGACGTTPSAQGMTLLTNPFFGASAGQSFAAGATTLDSTAMRAESAGYFGGARVPSLDRAAGYSLLVTLELLAEQHDQADDNGDGKADRAGLSLIVLSSDLRGIELGFWPDQVWAQADGRAGALPLFTQAEGAALDTLPLRRYELRVQGDSYTLLADGAAVLSGPLRDYSAFSGPLDPYETSNLVFIGDDTSRAGARLRLHYVALRVGGFATLLPIVAGT